MVKKHHTGNRRMRTLAAKIIISTRDSQMNSEQHSHDKTENSEKKMAAENIISYRLCTQGTRLAAKMNQWVNARRKSHIHPDSYI